MVHLWQLTGEWRSSSSFNRLIEGIRRGYRGQMVSGLEGSQKSFLVGGIRRFSRRPLLIITADQGRAEKIYGDLSSFLPAEELFLFPGRDFFFSDEILTHSKELLEQRLTVLERIYTKEQVVVIAPLASLLTRMVPFDLWKRYIFRLHIGQAINRERLICLLVEQGYERSPMIDRKGQFSVRGEIIDIFPYSCDNPLRLEFFGEEIESIRCFDVVNQRSVERLDSAVVVPAREVIVTPVQRENCIKAMTEELKKVTEKLRAKGREAVADRLKTRVQKQIQKIQNGFPSAVLEAYFPYFYKETDTLPDYFPENTLICLDEPERLAEAARALDRDFREHQSTLILQGEILPSQVNIFWDFDRIFRKDRHQVICFSLFSRRAPHVQIENEVNIEGKTAPSFHGQWELVREEIDGWRREGYRVIILAHSKERSKNLEETVREYRLPAACGQPEELRRDIIGISVGNLENGFILPEMKLTLLTEGNLLPKKTKRRRVASARGAVRLRDYQELEIGDCVVHEQHGIGRYLGIRTLDINGVNRDFLHIQYAGEDKLFIPTDQIDVIQKYVGVEGHSPKLNKLGGQEWNRVKSKVKASVEELARDLLSLYAARESVTGYAFSPDHPWQREFEERFPYEETPDQLRAIEEVKEDMERPRPMDRLLCGDVGYGKTEVALRAAFKAVMDGKQVAFLVPTTILAQQHYHNFKERFAGFPVNIELLSRFRSAVEQKKTLQGLRKGTIDIVIGTHRLFSSDVRFKELGLLVIDEEQRFGVRHKEKLKKMRLNVDVLTMTATPIPRTLHLSLAGGRDLSIIETPPEERHPVQTYVVEYSDNLVRDAIIRELNRNGQVYFVYNRVQNIEQWAVKIQRLVPEARIAVAHGQMLEADLERVMTDFLDKRYDVLVSTTIVEAGLDIPNVNTMIIYDADNFGLAQLYQLRGRVGRSNRVAYSYLTYRRDKILSEAAEKRLQAIKEFTELGSGFKIALRDLEIRGAGNILGPEQHGFMMAVGFSLYCQLLEEAISRVKGEIKPEKAEPRVELNVDAYLPESYIPSQQQKIDIYQRIASLESEDEVVGMERELKDRFGSLPHTVQNLLSVARLKILARTLSVESIKHEKDQVVVKFDPQKKFDGDRLWKLTERYRGKLWLQAGKSVAFKIRTGYRLPSLEVVEQFLGEVREVAN